MREKLALPQDPSDVDDHEDGVVAESLVPDLHLIPGLWKIDGDSGSANAIQERYEVEEERSFSRFLRMLEKAIGMLWGRQLEEPAVAELLRAAEECFARLRVDAHMASR